MRFIPLQESIESKGRSGEDGWALLGLLLALAIMSIIMTSSLTPIVGIQVQREKEEEMLYRGEAMAKGIARYYNNGNLNGIQLLVPPPYGFLTELKKLRDGFTIGVREVKFIRPSAIIDPMTGVEWEPVRARDPRVMKFLQAWAAETQQPIPQQYLLLAGPPEKMHLAPPSGETTPTPPVTAPGAQPPPAKPKPPANDNLDDDDDDDDDDDVEDPLAHIFGSGSFGQQGSSSTPIIGVAPKRRGASLRKLYGLDKYEDWVFIYIPPFGQNRPGINPRPGQPNQNNGRPRTSQ